MASALSYLRDRLSEREDLNTFERALRDEIDALLFNRPELVRAGVYDPAVLGVEVRGGAASPGDVKVGCGKRDCPYNRWR